MIYVFFQYHNILSDTGGCRRPLSVPASLDPSWDPLEPQPCLRLAAVHLKQEDNSMASLPVFRCRICEGATSQRGSLFMQTDKRVMHRPLKMNFKWNNLFWISNVKKKTF